MSFVLPKYEEPPEYVPPHMRRSNPNYSNRLSRFMPRLIYMKKPRQNEPLGFNIRGGVQQFSSIFVSKVNPCTLAYKYGLNEGDQLVSVNGIDFRTVNHYDAVKLFKESNEFLIVAKYNPYDYKKALPLGFNS